MASRRCIINAIMTPPTGNVYLAAIALLALLPVAALAWRRRRDGRRLPWLPGRAFLCFALAFLALVWADRLRGTPAVMGLAAVLYGILAGRARQVQAQSGRKEQAPEGDVEREGDHDHQEAALPGAQRRSAGGGRRGLRAAHRVPRPSQAAASAVPPMARWMGWSKGCRPNPSRPPPAGPTTPSAV